MTAAFRKRLRPRYGLLRVSAGILLFGLLFWIVDPKALIATLLRVDAVLLAAVVVLAVLWLLLGAVNVWILLRCRSAIRFLTFSKVYVLSWSMGLLIPGQLGDATQILLLRRHGLAVAHSTAAYGVDKAISLGLFGLIGLYGIARYAFGASPGQALAVSVLAAGAGACAVLASVNLAPRSQLPPRVREFLRLVAEEMAVVRARHDLLGLNVTISIAKWLVAAGMYYMVFSALGISLSFEAVATIPVVSSLVAYIPVSVGGLGTTEWTAVGLFHRIRIAPTDVIGAYVIMRAVLVACAATMLTAGKVLPYARSH